MVSLPDRLRVGDFVRGEVTTKSPHINENKRAGKVDHAPSFRKNSQYYGIFERVGVSRGRVPRRKE